MNTQSRIGLWVSKKSPELWTLISGTLIAGAVNILTSLIWSDQAPSDLAWALPASMALMLAAFCSLSLADQLNETLSLIHDRLKSDFIPDTSIDDARMAIATQFPKKFQRLAKSIEMTMILTVIAVVIIVAGKNASLSNFASQQPPKASTTIAETPVVTPVANGSSSPDIEVRTATATESAEAFSSPTPLTTASAESDCAPHLW